ncbi:hypothetical protein F511_33705 [Dorcoceras hygrometricum]|uniref:Uncharacterized protein n=1 Tax=Dorcoceras hygrometricum TaxID=472368 RepID=A0A2Z7CJ05_9LAMI|nr:hypothetical protein F511_33705 [Dorcoceras hygrometricum]
MDSADALCDEENQQIQQMVCDDTTSWCKSNDDQLECKSNDNQQLVATVHSDESYIRPAVDMNPVAKIQTQRQFQQQRKEE